MAADNNNEGIRLTADVVTTVDLSRIIREAEKLDDFLYQSQLRAPGSAMTAPKTTRTLEKVAEANGLSLFESTHRKHLIGNLKNLNMAGKKLHISFAVEPSPAVVQKIVLWLRENVHKDMLVEVGIQPTISVGCVVRTNNKIFDMSLKHRFSGSNNILSSLLEKTS